MLTMQREHCDLSVSCLSGFTYSLCTFSCSHRASKCFWNSFLWCPLDFTLQFSVLYYLNLCLGASFLVPTAALFLCAGHATSPKTQKCSTATLAQWVRFSYFPFVSGISALCWGLHFYSVCRKYTEKIILNGRPRNKRVGLPWAKISKTMSQNKNSSFMMIFVTMVKS